MTDVTTDHTVIANVDAISAPELVYPEAVYLHNGETYLVRELDLAGKVAYVERRETDYYTQAVLESNVRITGERATSRRGAASDARLWRRRRRLANGGVQEDQIRHAREHRPRARSTFRRRTCKRRPSGSRRTMRCEPK